MKHHCACGLTFKVYQAFRDHVPTCSRAQDRIKEFIAKWPEPTKKPRRKRSEEEPRLL